MKETQSSSLDRRGGERIVSIEGTDEPSEGLVSRRPGLKDSYEKDSQLQARVQTLYKELSPKFCWMTIVDGSKKSVGIVHDSVVRTVEDGLGLRVMMRVRSKEDSRP